MNSEQVLVMQVEGMSCQHCEANITGNLQKIDGIIEVIADRTHSEVRITGHGFGLNEIEEVISDLGYQFKGIIR